MNINVTVVKQNFAMAASITALLNGNEVAWLGEGSVTPILAPDQDNTMVFKSGLRKTEVSLPAGHNYNISLKWNRMSGKLEVLCVPAP